MNRLFTKIIFITAFSIAGFLFTLLLLPDRPVNRPNLTDLPVRNATPVPYHTTARDITAWPTSNILSGKQAIVNADSLKRTDWYQAVMADIEKKTYYMAADTDGRVSSINVAQGLAASYRADGFTLTPLQPLEESRLPKAKSRKRKKDWQLELKVKGLYADGKLACIPQTTTRATLKDGEANFCTAEGLIVQYQNTDAGVRQNFIVPRSPAGATQALRVALQAPKGWVINQVAEREIHFARRTAGGGLSTKIVYKDLVAWDADGRKLAASMKQKGHSIELVVAAGKAKYPVTIDPLSTTVATTLNGPSANSFFGSSVSNAGDVNGDGYSDVIVGAYRVASATGTAYLYYGSATGLSATATTTLTGTSVNNNFGYSVASAGDVNGDGYSDVIIGAYGVASNTGAAHVYHGSATGLSPTAAVTLTGSTANGYFGHCVASTGDVNGDGYSDVIVGAYGTSTNTGAAYVYHGSATGLSTTAITTLNGTANSYFGVSVSGADDVNGDGYSDVIIGAAGPASFTGAAYIYHGSATGLSATAIITLTGSSVNNYFGSSVSSAGDVNGDGYSDVIIGAYGVASNAGAAYVYHGSATGLSATAMATFNGSANSLLGNSVSGAGDVNGDGYSDVIVGAQFAANGQGAAYVYLGSATGLLSTTAVATFNGSSVNNTLGRSVAGAGDVNGDGYSDVIVGVSGASSNTGAAYLYCGNAGSISTTPANTFSVSSTNSYFGICVSGAGDVNGDGYSDVLVGAPGVASFTGVVYVYLGTAAGLSTIAAATLSGISPNSNFGFSVSGAGDVNGDGYSDVIVGSYGTTSNTGAAYLYLGKPGGLSSTPTTTLFGSVGSSNFGYSVSCAGDVNGDGYGDVIVGAHGFASNTGAAYVYHGSATGIFNNAATSLNGPSASSNFGYSVSGSGDVNGDGYSDVIVGAAGVAYVYHGSATGILATAKTTMNSPVAVGFFGYSVSGAGDVNGDGYSDVIVGAYGAYGSTGAAYMYHGSANGLSTNANYALRGVSVSSNFGFSVSSAGDVNGDGYSDVIIGAPGTSSGIGAAYVYHGSATGLLPLVAATLAGTSSNSNSYFGTSVCSTGDINRDGYSDVMVGAYGVASNSGAVCMYLGNGGNGRRNNTLRLYGTDLSTPLGASNLNSGKFGAGLFVRPFAGATKARLVWETAANGNGFTQSSPITNYTGYTGAQPLYTTIPPAGLELKTLIDKIPAAEATKLRVRVQYQSALLPNGQTFGPWIYPQAYLIGDMGSGMPFRVQPLPVKLLSFTARKAGNERNRIEWNTAIEEGDYLFRVERSSNGSEFITIGTVNGRNKPAAYTFYDEQSLAGSNYYRLQLTDANSNSTFSQVVSVIGSSIGKVTVAPVPAVRSIRITNTDPALLGKEAFIYSVQGKIVSRIILTNVQDLDISSWPWGLYLLQLPNTETIRLEKQ